jgi:hypothetical protein
VCQRARRVPEDGPLVALTVFALLAVAAGTASWFRRGPRTVLAEAFPGLGTLGFLGLADDAVDDVSRCGRRRPWST